MKKILSTLSAVVLMAGAVSVYAAGDAEAGKAKTAVCAGCHGADGNSMVPNFPKLAGQNASYIVKQLKDMKAGERNVPEMMAFLPGLSDQDMEDIGAYYAAQTVKTGKADPKLVELGTQLYRAGNAESGVTACAGCHGAKGRGMPSAGFPAIAGQHAAYIEAQLKAFRASGRGDEAGPYRTNDGEAMMMRATAARLTDSEIKALSSYINGLY
ncbi:MAG: cytochrome c4 [Gammaproteobacteria bacterium]|nr:MAG: cytochrome c4 [Gammaproteobacteria bacterium]